MIDLDAVMERLDGDMEIFQAACEAFVEVTPELLETLKKQVEAGALSRVAAEAHGLKGAASNIGAEIFREISLRIETAARQGDQAMVEELFLNLSEHFTRLNRYLHNKGYLTEGTA